MCCGSKAEIRPGCWQKSLISSPKPTSISNLSTCRPVPMPRNASSSCGRAMWTKRSAYWPICRGERFTLIGLTWALLQSRGLRFSKANSHLHESFFLERSGKVLRGLFAHLEPTPGQNVQQPFRFHVTCRERIREELDNLDVQTCGLGEDVD